MLEGIEFISVDLQNDFATEGGICFDDRPSVDFISKTLIPFLRDNDMMVSEIMSDYRQPRRGDPRYCCIPGDWGFSSILPRDIVKGRVWIKSMNDPTWIRKNGGKADEEPGEPYQDPGAFDEWLEENVGTYEEVDLLILFGLTADRCVLCTAQQLAFRGYDVRVLVEATDVASGDPDELSSLLNNTPFKYWSDPISFDEVKQLVSDELF
jgi:nicotinamidase-related amidase